MKPVLREGGGAVVGRGSMVWSMARSMARSGSAPGAAELRAAGRADAGLVLWAVLFGGFVNLLMLTGPLYMMQVYDRVLASRSAETLVALSVLALALFALMGVLDHARGQLAALAAARFRHRLDGRVFAAGLARARHHPGSAGAAAAQRDLEAVERYLAAPVRLALWDAGWTPLFVGAIFVFHPALGWLALAGGGALVAIAAANQAATGALRAEAAQAAQAAEGLADRIAAEAEVVQALGMGPGALARWQAARGAALAPGLALAARTGGFAALSRTVRLVLQSAMLGLGAWLVLGGEMSAGAMIAGSVLMGRALAPVELVVAQWGVVQQAVEGWRRLAALLAEVPAAPPRGLPAPGSAPAGFAFAGFAPADPPAPRGLVEAVGLTVTGQGRGPGTGEDHGSGHGSGQGRGMGMGMDPGPGAEAGPGPGPASGRGSGPGSGSGPALAAPPLCGVSFRVGPGQAMGVIGPSGSGKSTLARALAGIRPVAGGTLRLDGVPLDRYDPDRLGRATGYLPQRVTLFPGSVADNIARLDLPPDPWADPWRTGGRDGGRHGAAVVAAAQKAGAHEMILALPRGYDTPVSAEGASGAGLSGGQLQGIGLARALYGDPAVVILDEPNAHLDNDGSMALNRAVRGLRAAGRTVFIMAHRPAALQECDLLLVLEGGRRRAFGPRDRVLQEMLQNGSGVVRRLAAGQAS